MSQMRASRAGMGAVLAGTAAVIALSFASSGLARAASRQGEAEARLQRLHIREAQYTKAILTKDVALAAGVFSDDFFDTTSRASVIRKADYLKNLADPSYRMTAVKVGELVYLVHGDTAVVTQTYDMSGEQAGRPFEQAGRSTDVWVWERGDWWCVAAHSSRPAP